jgi:hypothetical protein
VDINLTGQTAKADQLRAILTQFREELDKRFAVWQRWSPEKRERWIAVAEEKDPLFHLFVLLVKYGRKWEISDG